MNYGIGGTISGHVDSLGKFDYMKYVKFREGSPMNRFRRHEGELREFWWLPDHYFHDLPNFCSSWGTYDFPSGWSQREARGWQCSLLVQSRCNQ
jgi:hypothetical protein